MWNLVAGTYGFFFPYILQAVGTTTPRATYALQGIWFAATAVSAGFLYMPLVDQVSRRKLLLWSSVLQIVAFVPFIFLHATFVVALFNVLLFGVGAGIGQQSPFQLWSGELFPTLLRSSAQGLMFGVVRIGLGGGSSSFRPSRRPASAPSRSSSPCSCSCPGDGLAVARIRGACPRGIADGRDDRPPATAPRARVVDSSA